MELLPLNLSCENSLISYYSANIGCFVLNFVLYVHINVLAMTNNNFKHVLNNYRYFIDKCILQWAKHPKAASFLFGQTSKSGRRQSGMFGSAIYENFHNYRVSSRLNESYRFYFQYGGFLQTLKWCVRFLEQNLEVLCL